MREQVREWAVRWVDSPVGSPVQAARANRTGLAECGVGVGEVRPPAVLNDVHELHDSGQRGEGTLIPQLILQTS